MGEINTAQSSPLQNMRQAPHLDFQVFGIQEDRERKESLATKSHFYEIYRAACRSSAF
jgi:hypothetical protein